MAFLVWALFLYSAVVFTALAERGGIEGIYSLIYDLLTYLALACHAKTMLTDPGSVPKFAAAPDLDGGSNSQSRSQSNANPSSLDSIEVVRQR